MSPLYFLKLRSVFFQKITWIILFVIGIAAAGAYFFQYYYFSDTLEKENFLEEEKNPSF